MKKLTQLFFCIFTISCFIGCTNTPEPKPKDLIVGTWEAVIEKDKIIWTVSPNGNEEFYWFHAKGIQHNSGKWTVENDILYEQFATTKTVCKLEFETSDHLILTVLDNGSAANRGQKRDYYRKNKEGNGVESVKAQPESKNSPKLEVIKESTALSKRGSPAVNAAITKPISTINVNNELIGIWEYSEQSTDNYGIKTTKISVWEFKSNGKWIYDIWNNYMNKPTHGISSYSYASNMLSEYDNSRNRVGYYKILWEDDYKSFTVESKNSINGSYFAKVSTNQLKDFPPPPGEEKQCGYCEGRGTVRCCDLGGFYKPDCLSQSVYINCMSNPTPCELRVTCCRCKGTGRY